MFPSFGPTSPDPGAFPDYFLKPRKHVDSSLNYADYSPPDVQQLVLRGIATRDPAKRLQIYGQILRRVATDVPYVPLFVIDFNYVIASNFSWPGFTNALSAYEGGAWALGVKASPRG
jgi:ABC-type transport system substrate-binding protein